MAKVQIATRCFDYYVGKVLCRSVEGEELNPQADASVEAGLLAMGYITIGDPTKVEALSSSLEEATPTVERPIAPKPVNKVVKVGSKGRVTTNSVESQGGVTEVTSDAQLGSALRDLSAADTPVV